MAVRDPGAGWRDRWASQWADRWGSRAELTAVWRFGRRKLKARIRRLPRSTPIRHCTRPPKEGGGVPSARLVFNHCCELRDRLAGSTLASST